MDEKYKFWQYLTPYGVSKYTMGLFRNIGNGSRLSLSNINTMIENGSEPQSVYLLDRNSQKKYMLQNDYTIDNTDNYGLVKKAVGNRKLPIYQTPGLFCDDNNMNVIGNINAINKYNWLGTSGHIKHGGYYPTALYYNDKDHYFYQRGWDLNDYGKDENKQRQGNYASYGNFKKTLANILDFVGNPMVISTGYRRTPFNINNITLHPDYAIHDDNININTNVNAIHTLQEQFNTWLKKHKGSSIINPYDNDNIYDKYVYFNPMYYDYSYDNNGNIIYDDNGKPKFNNDKRKKEIHKYMIVNTTKVPEVVAKRKRKCLGGIY